jgi:hypothetical protein
MPLSPEELADFEQLQARATPQAQGPAEIRGFFPRLWQGTKNIPGGMVEGIGQIGNLIGSAATGDFERMMPDEENPATIFPFYREVDAPKDIAELSGDVIPAIAKELPFILGPQAAGTGLARAAGAGPTLARVIGSVAAGGLSGARHSLPEAGIQAGEFGTGQLAAEFIPGGTIPRTLARMAAQAAVPLIGQAARGNNPLSKEGLVQAGVQALSQGVFDAPKVMQARRLMRAAPEQTAPPEPQPTVHPGPEQAPTNYQEPTFEQLFPEHYAEQNIQTGPIHGDVRPYARASTPEMPAEIGGPRVQPSGQGQAPAAAETVAGPRVVSTAIQLPDGGVVTGKSWDAAHPTMLMEALDRGVDPVEFPKALGFIVEDANGVRRFANRTEAGEIFGLKPGKELTSEHLRGEASAETQAAPSSPETMKLGRTGTTGATLNPLLGAITRAGIGGAAGYATGDTEEERVRNALLLGAGALVGPAVGRKLIGAARSLKPALEAAARKESGVTGNMAPSLLGKGVLKAEEYFNLGKKPETVTASERGKGALADIANRVTPALQQNEAAFREAWADPAKRAIGEKFLASPGAATDVAALDAAAVPQGFKDWLKAARAAKREAQPILAEAEASNSARRKLIQATHGNWQTNVYQIDADPKNWRLNEALVPKVVAEMKAGPLKDFDEATIEANLRQHLNERVRGTDQNLAKRTGSRIDQTLYEHLMDLTPKQWEFIDTMASDPRMPRGAGPILQKFFSDKSIDPSGQTFLKAMAGNKALTDTERQMFREIGEKKVITQNYRDLLGQIKDPAQRELYSLNKLFANIAQAKTISVIADTALESGAKLAYTADTSGAKIVPSAKAWEQARTNALTSGNKALYDELSGYVQLPESASLGKLSGAMVPRDVRNTLNEIQSTMGAVSRFFSKANSVTKEVATVWNPSTQIRQAAQTPFFMLAARVNPAQIVNAIKVVAADTRFGKATGTTGAVVSELHQQHMLGANYSEAELNQFARKLATGNTGNPIVKGLKTVRSAVMGLYGIPDDLVRAAAYLSHKPRFALEAAKKGLTGPAAEQYARDKATMFVNRYTMNYGQTSKAVKIGRNVPGLSPFLSYSSELTRLTKNMLQDIATGSASDKLWATTGLAALYAFPVALASWAKNKFLTPDQQKEWDRTERLMPQQQRGQLKLVTGKNKKGSFEYQGLNPWMPAGDLVSMIQNAAKGDWESFNATQPFFGWQKSPLASAVIDTTIKGEHSFTHQPIDTPKKVAGRIAEAFTPSLTPGVGFAGKKLQRAFTRNDEGTLGEIDPRTGNVINPQSALLSLAGVNQQVANPTLLRKRAEQEVERKLGDAKRELNTVLRSGAPSTQKKEAQKRFLLRRQEIQEEGRRLLGRK